jgi:copper chaperone NosL
MNQQRLGIGTRIMLFLAAIMLVCVLFFPIWKIELMAPQYPEGLEMTISAKGLGGNIDIINGLNHYIGMKTLHNDDFIEFKILPFIISVFALFFLITAIAGRQRLMYILFFSYVLFGIVAMADFWRWEYDYGHNLDPGAAIQVPGMSYQPPLIGFKQLLNFGAYSVPAIGGWLFIGAGGIILLCLFIEYRRKKKSLLSKSPAVAIIILSVVSLSACTTSPQPIVIGTDECQYCKMTISDRRFGAEIITEKGKIFKYDDLKCMIAHVREGESVSKKNTGHIYFPDFCEGQQLIESNNCHFLSSEELRSPMGGNIAAFASRDSLDLYLKKLGGREVKWRDIDPL